MENKGVNVEQYFKNVSHHHLYNGNMFYDLDFGENTHNIHLASPGERLHMHQLGCAKRAAEPFCDDFLGNSTQLLGDMDSIASYYSAAVQRKSNSKKEGNQYIDMRYIQMLSLLSAEGCQLLLSQRTTINLENRNRKCEEEINGRVYAFELLLGMEEFPKYAGTFDQSSHKTKVKAPAKRTQQSRSKEHKGYDNDCGMKLLFCAHPSLKSDLGQVANVWYDWANFQQLDLLDGHGLQVCPCQILYLLHLEGPFPLEVLSAALN
eukprot:jgi/Psemu1/27357/gm1.27357_g